MLSNSIKAQNYQLFGDKVFGTMMYDDNPSAIVVDNYNIVIASQTQAGIDNDKTDANCDSLSGFTAADIWLVKFDTAFNVIWNKSYGGVYDEYDVSLNKINNSSNFILTCSSQSDSSCEKTENSRFLGPYDYWFVCIDSNGNRVFDKTYGGTMEDRSAGSIQLKSGNYLIYGSSDSDSSADKSSPNIGTLNTTDLWVVMIDSVGNKIWDKSYGGTINETIEFGGGGRGVLANVIEFNDGSLLIGCTTDSPLGGSISDSSKGMIDIWIIKIDSLGNKLWDKRLGGSSDDNLSNIIKLNDDSFIITSYISSENSGDVSDTLNGASGCWIIKLDADGNKVWDYIYGGNGNCVPSQIKPAIDGGFLISATISGDSIYDVSEPTYGSYDYWIFKIDSVGNKLWDKRFGGPLYDACNGFVQMPDTSIFLYGSANQGISPVKTDSGVGGANDIWIVHFKYTDTTSTVGLIDPTAFDESISLYPNPACDVVTIASNKTQIQNITMYNLLGELIETKNYTSSHTIQFDLQTYPKGVYIAKITGQHSTVARKVVKN